MGKDKKIYYRNKGNKKFSQRFNRKRLEDPVHEIHGNKVYFEGIETDDYWNPYGPIVQTRVDDMLDGTFDLDQIEAEYKYDYGILYQFKSLLFESLFKIHNTPFKGIEQKNNHESFNNEHLVKNDKKSSNNIEKRLFSYHEKLKNIDFNNMDTIVPELVKIITDFDEVSYFIQILNRNSKKIQLALFAPFWIRKPSTWKPEMNMSIFEYVFGYYEPPKFLNSLWDQRMDDFNLNYIEYYLWFILFAQGGSLKKLSKFQKIPIKQKIVKFLYKVPENINYVKEGILFAEILSKGGTKREFNLIKDSHIFLYDVYQRHNEDLKFADSTIDWIIRHKNIFSDAELNLILQWANHEKIEANRNQLKPFSWKGRKPKRTLERAEEFQQTIIDSRNNLLEWEKNNLDWEYNENWQFVELTSSNELNEEGFKQNHCVGAYDYNCSKRIAAIVSMRYNHIPKLTIEITLNKKQIGQVRGKNNRLPAEDEKRVLSAWIKEMGIRR